MKKITFILALCLAFASKTYSQDVDAIATNVYSPYTVKDKVFHPTVEVENNGALVLDEVEVVFELLDAGNTVLETETQTYSGLALNNMDKVRLKLDTDWLLTVKGMFKIKCTLNVAGEENPADNILEIDMESLELDYSNLDEGAGYLFSTNRFYKTDAANTASELITPFAPDLFPLGMEFIDGVLYSIRGEFDPGSGGFIHFLMIINGDGIIYELGIIETEFLIDGIAWDLANDQAYVITDQAFAGNLGTLDLDTLSVTNIGFIGTNNDLYIGIDFNTEGVLYGLNFATNTIDIIDPTNPSIATPLPFAIGGFYSTGGVNYDISYNPADETLYATVFENTQQFDTMTYISIDLSTGLGTTILHLANTEHTLAISHRSNPTLGVNDLEANQFVIYPNPTKNVVTIEMLDLERSNYNILSMDGRVLMNGVINPQNKTIDISNLASSTYIISFEANGKQTTKKIIKL